MGVTLVELLVVLAILSILASVALPFAEIMAKRDKELELKRNLRAIRIAIDSFHGDWKHKRITVTNDAASADGYPKTLQVLVDGVTLAGNNPTKKRYLRKIPRNPFAGQSLAVVDQWIYRSYLDSPDSQSWGGQDVYDVRVDVQSKALDGSSYNDW